MKIIEVPYLVSMRDEILRAFPRDTVWELEETKASTNRLTLEVPLKASQNIITEMEILFNNKRYIISEISREKSSFIATIHADEAQIELSDKNIRLFKLEKASISNAMEKAVAGSNWTVGTVFYDENTYYGEFENISSMKALQFLESQSGGRLVFDSAKRVVHLLPPLDIEPTKVFRYKYNIENISKTEIQPLATVMYPYGKDGLSIESINSGRRYIEDYSWYTDLGISLADAKAKYTKEYVWEDERYIYPFNLLNDAKKKLAIMSKPQINYTIKASHLKLNEVSLNEPVYVIDDELGIKLKTVVSRIRTCKDVTQNEVELDYLPPSLSNLNDNSLGDSTKREHETSVFLVKNQSAQTITTAPAVVLTAAITVFTATHFEVGLKLEVECTSAGLLEGYFMMDGQQVGVTIKQTLQAGFYTIGLPFIITQVQEGTKYLDFYLKCSGSVTLLSEKAEMFITSKGAYGGMSNDRPDQRVFEMIPRLANRGITERVSIALSTPLRVNVSNNISRIGLGAIYESVTNNVQTTMDRSAFAQVANYSGYNLLPDQSTINTFIDTTHGTRKLFKVVTVGSNWYLFTTAGNYITVDTENKRIRSNGNLYSVATGSTSQGTTINLSTIEGVMTEREIYGR